MKVKVKLFAMLDRYLPPGSDRNEAEIELANGATPAAVMEQLRLPTEMCHLVLVNGIYVAPDDRETRKLKETDVVAIWPPVAGG